MPHLLYLVANKAGVICQGIKRPLFGILCGAGLKCLYSVLVFSIACVLYDMEGLEIQRD